MAQEFCSVEQAAQMLNLSPQELNAMAQRREIRAFSDRGTWRFRLQDVQELARRRGVPSSEEIPVLPPKSAKIPKSGKHPKPPEAPIPLTASMEEQPLEAEIVMSPGDEIHLTPQEDIQVAIPAEAVDIFESDDPSSASKRSTSKSEIILVPKEGELELLATEDEGPASSSFVFPTSKKPKAPAPTKTEKEVPDDGGFAIGGDEPPTTVGDSQVRLDSLSGRLPDSGVRLVDFDLPSQLSGLMPPPPSSRKMPKPPSTVDLLRPGSMPGATPPPGSAPKMAPGSGKQPAPKSGKVPAPPKSGKIAGESKKSLHDIPGLDPAAAAQLANLSPTDSGSESALAPGMSLSDFELEVTKNEPGDSVFDLTASKPSAPSLELELTSELDVGEVGGSDDTVDISGGSRQKPAAGGTMRGKIDEQTGDAGSGTFELSMDSDEFSTALSAKPESSEFDLSLEGEGQTDSSDFELTLEGDAGEGSGEFAASIEVRPDQVETSDFELALDEDSSSEILEETTDSEVVVIDDEEAVPAPARGGVAIDDEDLVVEEAVEEEPAMSEAAMAAAATPAEWGYWSLTLVPTVLIMPIVGFLLFEMLRSASSYNQPGIVTGPIYSLIRDMTK